MKKLFPMEMLDGASIEKASVTQYVRWGWHERALFGQNAWRVWYKKAPLTQYARRGWNKKNNFTENAKQGCCKKVPLLTQYIRQG